MRIVNIEATQTVEIPVLACTDLFSPTGWSTLSEIMGSNPARCLVFVDSLVWSVWGEKIEQWRQSESPESRATSIVCQEEDKTLETLGSVLNIIQDFNPNRRSEPILAVGGGSLMDIISLAAGIYRRGVPCIRIPTTLLGMVDAAIGAKTGVNFRGFRNRLGTYSASHAAILDPSFLSSLPRRQLSSGMGEILKLALIGDSSLFEKLERFGVDALNQKFEPRFSHDLIFESARGMAQYLQQDLWEKNLRRATDFGHSFSPLIEMELRGEVLHGEAVALDICLSSALSFSLGHLSEHDLLRVLLLTKSLGLPYRHKSFADLNLLRRALSETWRHRNGSLNLPLPRSIGAHFFLEKLDKEDLGRAVSVLGEADTAFAL